MYKLQIALLIMLVGLGPANAVVTTFDDRAAFDAAVAGLIIVDDDFDTDIAQAQSIVFVSGVESINAAPPLSFFTDNSVTGGLYRNALERTNEPVNTSITWTFPVPVTGFGFDVFRADNTGLRVTIDDGSGSQTFLIYDVIMGTGNAANGFAGFVGMAPFSTVQFTSAPADFDSFEMDNLTFASPIPVPAAFWLFGSAVLLLARLRR
ncbi:MAG: PEP-CTERM sorting domain-containing protein [Gammaproteobacteria bacterium]|nr:PEP-CTERM sorting domain-containing protein [Gammaproteobacteria bacterium]